MGPLPHIRIQQVLFVVDVPIGNFGLESKKQLKSKLGTIKVYLSVYYK
jgi:hypothetical protein